MRIALHDLRAHLPQLVNEVQPTLEHLLEEETSAAGLRRKDDQHAEKIRRKRRPGAVRDGRNRVAEIVLHAQALLRNIPKRRRLRVDRPGDAETGERSFQNIKGFRVNVLKRQFSAGHRRGHNVASGLDVIAADARLASMQRLHAFDYDPIGPGARDLRAHRV